MPSVDLITLIAATLGIGVAVVLASVALLAYPQARLLLSDVLKTFGFLGRFVRRIAIASEVEGSVNSFVKRYNSEAEDLVLPECRVEWVTSDNHSTTATPGTVIVRVSL